MGDWPGCDERWSAGRNAGAHAACSKEITGGKPVGVKCCSGCRRSAAWRGADKFLSAETHIPRKRGKVPAAAPVCEERTVWRHGAARPSCTAADDTAEARYSGDAAIDAGRMALEQDCTAAGIARLIQEPTATGGRFLAS